MTNINNEQYVRTLFQNEICHQELKKEVQLFFNNVKQYNSIVFEIRYDIVEQATLLRNSGDFP